MNIRFFMRCGLVLLFSTTSAHGMRGPEEFNKSEEAEAHERTPLVFVGSAHRMTHDTVQPELGSEQLLLSYLRSDILEPRAQAVYQKWVPRIVNGMCALSRGSVYLVLGYKLGHDMIEHHTDGAGKKAFAAVYGTMVALPMSALAITGNDGFLEQLLSKESSEKKAIKRARTLTENFLYWGKNLYFVPPLAIISSSTFGYITYEELEPIVSLGGVIVPVALNMYNRAVMDQLKTPIVLARFTDSVLRLFGAAHPNPLVHAFSPLDERRIRLLNSIKRKMDENLSYINSLDREQFENFYDRWEEGDSENRVLALLNPLRNGHNIQAPAMVGNSMNNRVARKCFSGNDLMGFLSGLVGVGGMWVYLPATTPAFEEIFGEEGVGGQISLGLAITALTSASSIFYYTASDTGAKIYDGIKALLTGNIKMRGKQLLKRSLIAFVSASLAAVNASQIFQVGKDFSGSENETIKDLELAAAYYSFFSLAFWGLDQKLVQWFMHTNPQLKSRKEVFIALMRKAYADVPEMNTDILERMNILMSARPAEAI